MRRLSLIVAACENEGIGIDGHMPWDLPNEYNYYNRVSSLSMDEGKKNAVIMGRKTWESIPDSERPLEHRINIVLSRTLDKDALMNYDTLVFSNLNDAVSFVESNLSDKVSEIFILGGTAVYEEALNSAYNLRLYYTRIFHHFDVDVFFPKVNYSQFKRIELDYVPQGIQEEKGVKYEVEVYDRLK